MRVSTEDRGDVVVVGSREVIVKARWLVAGSSAGFTTGGPASGFVDGDLQDAPASKSA